jgi:N-acetylglucosaminyldiphosphoundecaprenol N-acetyl-beta-D-mannosaminyltransferase
VLFVGLGTPKQELWMAANRGPCRPSWSGSGPRSTSSRGTSGGHKRQAPSLLQRLGLEWLFRLVNEPRRLWRRYLYRNPRFIVLFAAQLLRHWFSVDGAPRRQDPATGDEQGRR